MEPSHTHFDILSSDWLVVQVRRRHRVAMPPGLAGVNVRKAARYAGKDRGPLQELVVNLPGVTSDEYTVSQMTYDLRRLRLKGVIFRPPKTNRYFVTPYRWKVARLFTRLETRVFRPAVAAFTTNDAVLPFPLRASLNRVDRQLDELIYDAFPQAKVG